MSPFAYNLLLMVLPLPPHTVVVVPIIVIAAAVDSLHIPNGLLLLPLAPVALRRVTERARRAQQT